MQTNRRFRQLLVQRIVKERNRFASDLQKVKVSDIAILEIETFPMNKWGDTGKITIEYNSAGNRAIYGFTSLAKVQCYAD